MFNHFSTLQLLIEQLKDMYALYFAENFKQRSKNIMNSFLLFSQRYTHEFNKILLLLINQGKIY